MVVLCARSGTGASTILKLYPRIQFALIISNGEMHKIGYESALSVGR